jgi:hypothetical protein
MVLTPEMLEKKHGSTMGDATKYESGVSLDMETPPPAEDDDDDDQDSASNVSSGTASEKTSSSGKKQERAQEDKMLGGEMNHQVLGIRLLVVLALVLSTVTVAVLVFLYVSNQENTEFEETFAADANKVLVSLGAMLDITMGALDSFVVGMASYARMSESSWPLVTLPDFGVKAKKTRSLSNAVYMNVYMVITDETRLEWESYTGENNYWVNETIAIQDNDSTYHGEVNYSWVEHNVIHNDWGDMPYNRTTLLPQWQAYPVIPCSYGCPEYNWDVLGIVDIWSLEKLLDTGKVVFSEAYHLPDENDPVWMEETGWSIDWFANYVDVDQDPSEPVSDIYYPVFDNAAESVEVYDSQGNRTHEEGNLVAILANSIYWRSFIEDVSIFGVVVHVEY